MALRRTPTENSPGRLPERCCDPKDYTQHRGTENTEERIGKRGRNVQNSEVAAHNEDCISIHGSYWKIANFPVSTSLCPLCPLCSLWLCVGFGRSAFKSSRLVIASDQSSA